MKTISGNEQTLREYFSAILVPNKPIRTQLIQRTERATDNRVYIVHQKEHSPVIKSLIKQLDTKLAATFSKEALSASRGAYTATSQTVDTHSTPATKKNAVLLKTLFGDPTQSLNTRPPSRHFQRKSIQAQYPHEYSKLPTIKSNAWDDRRA